ncbi:MAG: 3-phosphoshikimate 1-carboxyvinyltransferase [Phycisphaerales bacterium]|nr:3-phosphoshikimate 1-carboxyvinyltransferase [Phycisphaerales bacterium]
MKVSLDFKSISGTISIPPSKSITQRICAAALLHRGQTKIKNIGSSNDEKAAINILQQLGAAIQLKGNEMTILSDSNVRGNTSINCGESGLSARLFIPIAALSNQPITIKGEGSLLQRPMLFFQEVLTQLNVSVTTQGACLPFRVSGPLQAKSILVNGNLSSQFISGLLLALSASATESIILEVDNLVSKPYIDLTLEILSLFGKTIHHQNYHYFHINPSFFSVPQHIEITVESDWSSAAFWIAAATIKGSLVLSGLNQKSNQADKIMLHIIGKIGAKTLWENDVLKISSGDLNAFDADLTDAPDLFPVLAVLAACCDEQSKLTGLHRLAHKESNRAESITQLLAQLAVPFAVEQDTLIIQGVKYFNTIEYDCPNDHRMAMAAALASMRSEGRIQIMNAECVNKSYPDFWKDLTINGKF